MSIIIKGINIPRNCEACPCVKYERDLYKFCGAKYKIISDDVRTRPDWCPARELPLKHGVLLDGKEIFDKVCRKSEKSQGDKQKAYSDVITLLVNTPVIFESEDPEEVEVIMKRG